MADRVFCIDFGSAYTKVALRRDPGADSELLSARTRGVAEADFCISSTVAVDRRGPKPVPEFGDRAAGMLARGGVDVYRNWKKWLFNPSQPTDQLHQAPLDQLLQSAELRELATKFGVAPGQLTSLLQLVTASKNLIAGSHPHTHGEGARHQSIAAAIAPHYFQWLRQQVLEACSRLATAGLKYDAIPVRLTVPAFAQTTDGKLHPGTQVLLDALGRAGWPIHPDHPVSLEPYANAIGVLTKGSNVFQKGRVRIGEMFGKSPLITVMKDASHHPVYRALVIDVGAFTTDFAMLTMTPDGVNESEPHRFFRVAQKSISLGVSDLDAHLISVLPKEKSDWLSKASALNWEDLRPAVYTESKGLRVPVLGIIGGPADAEAVASCLTEFAKKLSEETQSFLESCGRAPDGSLEELILSGGGSFIPKIRDSLREAAQASGVTYVKTHAADLKRTTGGPPVDKLDERFARGGSALGGASIYFEKSLD